jgi:uncharacterized protein (DUF1499 family)
MKLPKVATGLAGLGLAYGIWRNWGRRLDRIWERLAGPVDSGLVDFAALRRRRGRSDALASPPGICANAPADFISPDFPVATGRLRAIVAEIAAAEPNTELVMSDSRHEYDRYVAHSRLLHFPDTIDVKIISRGEGRSTLAIYSRSEIAGRFGGYDFGVNRKRIGRWLARIGEIASQADVSGG